MFVIKCQGSRGLGSITLWEHVGQRGQEETVRERAWQIQWLLLSGRLTGPRKMGASKSAELTVPRLPRTRFLNLNTISITVLPPAPILGFNYTGTEPRVHWCPVQPHLSLRKTQLKAAEDTDAVIVLGGAFFLSPVCSLVPSSWPDTQLSSGPKGKGCVALKSG